MSAVSCVILTPGGKHRMEGLRPKVLYPLLGEPILGYVLNAVEGLGIQNITLVADKKPVEDYAGRRGAVVYQQECRGSAHALLSAVPRMEEFNGDILLVYSDRPMLKASTLRMLIEAGQPADIDAAVLTVMKKKPEGYGRIVRDETGRYIHRTPRDCDLVTAEDRYIQEVVAGCYFFKKRPLLDALKSFNPVPEEFLMTDVLNRMGESYRLLPVQAADPAEVKGIDSVEELEELERRLRAQGFQEAAGVALAGAVR
jgi:bifunctional UDP-N-acetylglucosamine pyrophosphorylase / glucosamine-1-phosphate N-acetyltransferase